MNTNSQSIGRRPVNRRSFIRGALAASAVLPLSSALAACAGGGSSDDNNNSGGKKSDDNPFGMTAKSTVDAVIFDGGYGTDYVAFAGALMQKNQAGSTVKVSATTEIAQELQPRFVGGDPPDLIDNSGENAIGFSTILDQLEDLSDVLDANNLEGTPIRDTLFGGVEEPGTFDGKLAALNYVLTVYAVWYSASLFKENGWEPPKTWDEALDLGAKAKAKGKYLFLWGKEAATYYQTLAIGSAIKEGGDEVRLALENLDEGLLVPARGAGRLQGHGRDHRCRLREAGRFGHPVHRRPGPVEQQCRLRRRDIDRRRSSVLVPLKEGGVARAGAPMRRTIRAPGRGGRRRKVIGKVVRAHLGEHERLRV